MFHSGFVLRRDDVDRAPGTDARSALTPHMREYDAQFSDAGEIRWMPYIMCFHPADYRSSVVNTDSLGFRFTMCDGQPIAVDGYGPRGAVNVLAGSSTTFGIGASSDSATIPSRLNLHSAGRSAPWINMGGRSHNSAQELLLHVLLRHRLPEIGQIVVFSGFNDLGLARLPAALRFESGAFFLCNAFFERLEGKSAATGGEILGLDQQIRYAAGLVLRHLDVWRALADDAGAKLTYVLQPLASWVRERGTEEEEALFSYLDELGHFSDTYGDISRCDVGERYAHLLREGCEQLGIGFADMAPLIAAALEPTDWMFVDRIHFTDFGYDLAARLLLDEVLG
ncbi:MAG TPA: SGNH/GDSL hydrolase family protein [Solirubrobacteraceae bacterium]|nr:SGNH/GDSL hydrolase family protein [Solirubrobacteraceae bacterium]